MSTLVLTGNAASLCRLGHEIKAVAATSADNKNISFTLDDSDFSITYTDGSYGSKKKPNK